jgi:hypothetical protein
MKFAGTGGSTILITREPTPDAEKRRDRISLALFEGADFNTTHIASEQSEGICRSPSGASTTATPRTPPPTCTTSLSITSH